MVTQRAASIDMSSEYDEEATFLRSEESDKILPNTSFKHVNQSARSPLPWMVSTLILAIIAIASIGMNYTSNPLLCSRIRPSDMKDARKAIHYEERKYTGALVYDPETNNVQRLHDAEIQYFGPPSIEINHAWEDLLRGEFPTMTPAEAALYAPDLTPLPNDNNYHFEPDMFHNLHCINAIRMMISKTVYPDTDPALLNSHDKSSQNPAIENLTSSPQWTQNHIDHCMDRLMQSIICHGDLTPSPLYYLKGFPIALGISGKHTCRKFAPIREWMDARNWNGTAMEGV